MTPAFVLALILAVWIGAFATWLTTPVRYKVRVKEVVPPELARLAQNLGITKDIPASESYGRRIHDYIEQLKLEHAHEVKEAEKRGRRAVLAEQAESQRERIAEVVKS